MQCRCDINGHATVAEGQALCRWRRRRGLGPPFPQNGRAAFASAPSRTPACAPHHAVRRCGGASALRALHHIDHIHATSVRVIVRVSVRMRPCGGGWEVHCACSTQQHDIVRARNVVTFCAAHNYHVYIDSVRRFTGCRAAGMVAGATHV